MRFKLSSFSLLKSLQILSDPGSQLEDLLTLQKYQVNIVAGLLEVVNYPPFFIVCELSLIIDQVSRTEVENTKKIQALWSRALLHVVGLSCALVFWYEPLNSAYTRRKEEGP